MSENLSSVLGKALAQAKRIPPRARIGIGAAVVLLVVVLVVAGDDDERGATGGKVPKLAKPTKNDPGNVGAPRTKRPDIPTLAERRKKKKTSGCGEEATETCVPSLPVGASLKNDGLTWSIQSVRTMKRVGDPAVPATGTFLAVKVKVSSGGGDARTLTEETTALKMGGSDFATDGEATLAVVGENQPDFLYSDVGGGKAKTGTLLFDVPPDRVGQPAQLRVNRVGDATKVNTQYGFLKLPPVS